MQPTVGRIVHCWPATYLTKEQTDHALDNHVTVNCAAIICDVGPDHIAVHYFRVDGAAGGRCLFSAEPNEYAAPGHWWWPPRA